MNGKPLPGGITFEDVTTVTGILTRLEAEARLCTTESIADRFVHARTALVTWPWPWPQGTINPDDEEGDA